MQDVEQSSTTVIIRHFRQSFLHCRWGDVSQLASYTALLLHSHEFSLLNCTFASMPELAVDEKMLKEIKEVSPSRETGGLSLGTLTTSIDNPLLLCLNSLFGPYHRSLQSMMRMEVANWTRMSLLLPWALLGSMRTKRWTFLIRYELIDKI